MSASALDQKTQASTQPAPHAAYQRVEVADGHSHTDQTTLNEAVHISQPLTAAEVQESRCECLHEMFMSMKKTWSRYYPTHRNQVVWMLAGFLAACALLVLGIWRGLLVIVLVGAGYVVGQIKDGNPAALRSIMRMFRRR